MFANKLDSHGQGAYGIPAPCHFPQLRNPKSDTLQTTCECVIRDSKKAIMLQV